MGEILEQQKVRDLMSKLSPEQRGVATALATLRVENANLREGFGKLKQQYDELFTILMAIVGASSDREVVIGEEDFKTLIAEYRLSITMIENARAISVKLLTLKD